MINEPIVNRKIKVSIPASSANLGPGFDTLGIALPVYLEFEVVVRSRGPAIKFWNEGVEISSSQHFNSLAVKALIETLTLTESRPESLEVRISSQIPAGKGLGSSAAALLAGIIAGNEISGGKLTRDDILNLAWSWEGHPDNVVPSFTGGITVSMVVKNQVYYRRIDPPDDLYFVLAVPDFKLPTDRARRVRPEKYASGDVVFNLQRFGYLVASLALGQIDNLTDAMKDAIHQPYREKLIPGFSDTVGRAIAAGASGAALSGAGPSIIALVQGNKSLDVIGRDMLEGFRMHGIEAQIISGKPCSRGAVVEKE